MKKVALALIINEKGKFFLQHRDSKAPTSPNKWSLWGGQIEDGELPIEALCRELKEELSIVVTKDKPALLTVIRTFRHGDDWEGHVFLIQEESNFKYVLGEGDGMGHFSFEEVLKLDADVIVFQVLDKLTELNFVA